MGSTAPEVILAARGVLSESVPQRFAAMWFSVSRVRKAIPAER